MAPPVTYREWKFSDGEVFDSLLAALIHLKRNRQLTVVRVDEGAERDVTEALLHVLDNHGYGAG